MTIEEHDFYTLILDGSTMRAAVYGDASQRGSWHTASSCARLFAAAPQLLAACQKALARHKHALSIRLKLTGFDGGKLAEEIALMEAAIAKTTGETP